MRRLRIYVASAFGNREAVKVAHKILRAAGYEITHDWTNEDSSAYQGPALAEYIQRCASDDLHGVKSSDVVVAISHPAGCGLWWECGAALSDAIPILLIRQPDEKPWTVFFDLPGVRSLPTVESALPVLAKIAGNLGIA